jgi:hypothetical protein
MLMCRSGQVGVEVEVANIPPLLLVLPLPSIPHTPLVPVLPLKQHSPCHSAPLGAVDIAVTAAAATVVWS